MQPNLLFRPRTKRTRPQQILHLPHTREQNVPRHKPSEPLLARRAGERPLIRPEVAEVGDLADGLHGVDGHVLDGGGVVKVDHRGRQLGEEV